MVHISEGPIKPKEGEILEDEKLLGLFLSRKEDAIRKSQQRYGKILFSIANNILGDISDAEECENDTYLAAWNQIPPEKPQNLGAYLAKITRHLALKKLRHKTATKRGGGEGTAALDELMECTPDSYSFDQHLQANELKEALDRFLASLDPDHRRAFVLRYWYCESIKQIAKALDNSEANTKMMLYRTRQKLLVFLQKEEILQ